MDEVALPAPPVPESARFIGILNCVFGGLGMIWNPLLSLGVVLAIATTPDDPWFERVMKDPVYRTFLIVFILFATVACIVQIASGLGLMKGRRWGWLLGVGYAVFSLVAPVIEFLADYILATHQIILEAGRAKDEDAFATEMVSTAIHVVYNVVMMIYPAILLYVLLRPEVRRAFAKRP